MALEERRGLPKLYKWNERCVWKVKEYFNDPEVIERRQQEKFFLQKEPMEIPEGSKIVLFTWVMEDGWGDYYTQLETAKLLHTTYPHLYITLISLIHKDRTIPLERGNSHLIFRYKGGSREEIIYEEFPEEVYDLIREAGVLIQIPTFFPHTQKILNRAGPVRHELIGECGFIDSAWFHPKSSAHCMGLHFLEKGIIIKTLPLKQIVPCFNLDYTKTTRGNYVFLHTLLKALENDDRDITIATSSLHLYIYHLEKSIRSLLEKFRVGTLILHFRGALCPIPILEKGKQLIVKHFEHVNHEQFLEFFSETDQLVGCTGDGSIGEAISAGKPFFYDAPVHKRNFLKDIIAVAEEHLNGFPETLSFLQLSLKNSHLILEDVKEGWVSEEFILVEKEKTSPEDTRDETLAEKMGELLQLPRTKQGFALLGSVIRKKYAINSILCNIAARNFCK